MASELILKDPEVEATVDVRYRFDTDLSYVVPVEMREYYTDLYGSRVEGTATYANFRRFQVQVAEGVRPEEDPPPDRN